MFQENKKAYVALFTGAILIGFSPVLIKLAGAPGVVSSFYRLFFGALTLTPLFFYHLYSKRMKIPLKGILIATLAGLAFALDMSFWTTGIMVSTATMPTITGNLSPVWVGIMAMLFFKERNKPAFWVGLGIAFLGVCILVFHDFYSSTGMFKGLMLGLIAGLFYAMYIILTQPGRRYLNTLTFLYISTLATTFFLSLFLVIQGYSFTGYPIKSWVIFMIMGIVLQAGAWFLINYSQGHLPASLISPTLLTQPVLAAFIAFLMIDERLTVVQISGGCIVILGIYLVHSSRVRKKGK